MSRPCQRGPARQGDPSTRTLPSLSARLRSHLTASNRSAGSGRLTARSSSKSSPTVAPPRGASDDISHRQPSSKRASGSSSVAAAGTGTIRFRRRNPAAFSTDPFSWPEWGLQ